MHASKEWLIETLRNSARLGRQRWERGDEHLRGPRLFSNGIHVMQDFFAHSNFCEVGINILIREGGLKVHQRGSLGLPTGKSTEIDRGTVLDTMMHARDAGGDPQKGNLAVGGALGPGGGGREVLTTGTFNSADTIASLLEEVGDRWKILDPLDEGKESGEPSELVMACLDYLQMNPDDPTKFDTFGGPIVADLNGLIAEAQELVGGGGDLMQDAGELVGEGLRRGGRGLDQASEVGLRGGADLLRNLPEIGGPLADELQDRVGDGTGGAMESAGGSAADWVEKRAAAVAQFVGKVEDIKIEIDQMAMQPHALRNLYTKINAQWPLGWLKGWVYGLPLVGPKLAKLVEKAQDAIRTKVQQLMAAAWNRVVAAGERQLNGIIGQVRAQTNLETKKRPSQGLDPSGWGGVGDAAGDIAAELGNVSEFFDQETGRPKMEDGHYNAIAPGTHAPPSHTELAKDHPTMENYAGTHEYSKENGEEGEEEGSGHGKGHEHPGAWLYGAAARLAEIATEAVGMPVAECWDLVDKGTRLGPNDRRLDKIDAVVDAYFRHPADCSFWRAPLTTAISFGDVGPELLERLASKKATVPDVPSRFEIPADHPANRGDLQSGAGDGPSSASDVPEK